MSWFVFATTTTAYSWSFHCQSLGCSSSSSPSSSSLDWKDDSIQHPSTLILDLFSLSRRFIAFPIALDTTRELVFLSLIFASYRFPPLSRSPSPTWSRSVPPSLPLALSIRQSLARVQSSSRTDNIHNQVHKTSQNTSIKPTLFSRLRSSFIIGNPIPSHHPYPYVYTSTSTSCIHISHITTASNIVICIPHPPIHPHMANP